MELDYQPAVHPREWHDRQAAAGPSNHAPIAFTQTTSSLSQRRRSSAAHVRPALPPPNLPIPRIPDDVETADLPLLSPTLEQDSYSLFPFHVRQGPSPSPNLAAVATFSQTRMNVAATQSPQIPAPISIDDLSDPPPVSFLPPPPPFRTQAMAQEPDPPRDRDPDPRLNVPNNRPPSSRRALTRALELAREAVQLDSTNDHPEEAVAAYGRSVALLSEVMDRVRRGESSEVVRRGRGRRRSPGAQEEEIRRLQNIHDTYADRMNILSTAYSIPPIPYSTHTLYHSMSISTDSAPSTSPTASSASPSSDAPDIPPSSDTTEPALDPPEVFTDDYEAIGTAMFSSDLPSPMPTGPSSHPYATATQYDIQVPPRQPIVRPARRVSSAASLPPALPPPANSLPPAPQDQIDARVYNDPSTRQRSDTNGHRRTGSGGRLGPVEEEYDEGRQAHPTRSGLRPPVPDTSRNLDSPLPPLPSPTLSDGPLTTPRNLVTTKPPPSPRLSNATTSAITPVPRVSSQFIARTDAQMINNSVREGSIIVRRGKTSAPPTPRSSSPTGSIGSAASMPRSGSSGTTPAGGTRSRSSSQPGRRPSVVNNGRVSPLDRPPMPVSAGVVNGSLPPQRKSSFPGSKLGPNGQIQLTVQTDLMPSLGVPASLLATLPTTPMSPLPPAAPNDPLRKPYHLMNLLRSTMMSGTGGYITRRLHVPQEVWSQGGAKLANLIEKVRVVTILCAALEELEVCSTEYFGAGNVSSGMALGIGSLGRKEGEAWIAKLEDFSSVCDGLVANFGKKLGVGEGFVDKKRGWGDKIGRRFDKITNGKNTSLDSPAAYVTGLKKLFLHTQLLDEHTKAVTSQPVSQAYTSFPPDIRLSAEAKLKRSSEFFASVVLTFVIRDLSQLLDKYAKKCEKWMAE